MTTDADGFEGLKSEGGGPGRVHEPSSPVTICPGQQAHKKAIFVFEASNAVSIRGHGLNAPKKLEITLGFCHPVRVASMRVALSRQNQFAQSRTTAATHSALATCLEMETVFGARGRSAPAGSRVEKEGKEEEIMTRQLASARPSFGRERGMHYRWL